MKPGLHPSQLPLNVHAHDHCAVFYLSLLGKSGEIKLAVFLRTDFPLFLRTDFPFLHTSTYITPFLCLFSFAHAQDEKCHLYCYLL